MSDIKTGKISATISVWSDRISPARISALLGLQPDRSSAATWQVMCVENQTQNPSDVLSMLIIRLTPYTSHFRALSDADPTVSITVFLNLPPQPDPAALFIRRDVMHAIASIGGNLEIEFGQGDSAS